MTLVREGRDPHPVGFDKGLFMVQLFAQVALIFFLNDAHMISCQKNVMTYCHTSRQSLYNPEVRPGYKVE